MSVESELHPPSMDPREGLETDPGCTLQRCGFCGGASSLQDHFTQRYGCSAVVPIPGIPEGFQLLMDAFPIGVKGGHLLLVPADHLPSLALVTDRTGLERTLAQTQRLLHACFPDHWLFFFEHGAGMIEGEDIRCGGCHVDHAHGHILLLDDQTSYDEIVAQTRAALEELGWNLSAQELCSEQPLTGGHLFSGARPYLQLGRMTPGRAEQLLWRQDDPLSHVPSQLMRKLICEAGHRHSPIDWNWKLALQRSVRPRLERYRKDALAFQEILRRATHAYGWEAAP